MNNLKYGTKVKMLNDCSIGHFKKGDILTIDKSVDYGYDCIEMFEDGIEPKYIEPKYIELDNDEFMIVDLEIFNELGD